MAGAVWVLDLTVYLCVFGGKATDPLLTTLALALCRIAIIVFGDR